MAYDHIENIRDSSDEKVAMLLSFKNMIGILGLGGPTYFITAGMEGPLRIALLIAAGVLGFLLTVETGGMTVAGRVLWQLRGLVRLRLQGDRIDPAKLPGTSQPTIRPRILPMASPIRPLGYGGPRRIAPAPAPTARTEAAPAAPTTEDTHADHAAV